MKSFQDMHEKNSRAYENQITSKQVYQILMCFDKIYFDMTDSEKKGLKKYEKIIDRR